MNRFYKNEFPKLDDVVYVKVTKQIEAGFYVELLEYDKLEAFISLGEVTRKKKWIKKAIGVGRRQPLTVLHVDKENKYIDLSKRRLNKDEEDECIQSYYLCKHLLDFTNKLYEFISIGTDIKMEDFFHHTLWKLYGDYRKEELDELYPKILMDPMILLTYYEKDYKTEVMELCEIIKPRVTITPYTYYGEFRLLSRHSDGANKIKTLLEKSMTDTNNKDIEIVAPPIYRVKLISIDSKECVKKFNTLMNYLQKNTKDDKLFAFSKTDKLKEITKLKVTFK